GPAPPPPPPAAPPPPPPCRAEACVWKTWREFNRDSDGRALIVTYRRSSETTTWASISAPVFTTLISGSNPTTPPPKNGGPPCALAVLVVQHSVRRPKANAINVREVFSLMVAPGEGPIIRPGNDRPRNDTLV